MELPVKIQFLLKADSESFICCTGKDYMALLKPHQQKQGLKLFEDILNGLGALSAKAQALKQIITSFIKFTGTDNRIYIKIKDNKALGFVKVGQKNLFYRDFIGNIKELKPTCILDIYVHQSCQRSGIGKEIFEKFLKAENKIPQKLAYDRPSQKLISFLKKHYGLAKFIPQNNNFVIYDQYFNKQISRPKQVPKETQSKVSENAISNTIYNAKMRPKSYVAQTKVQQQEKPIKIPQPAEQKVQKAQTKRQFKQYQTFYQHGSATKHKNTTSEGFPLSNPLSQNPTFRTTSNAYGNHYHYRKKI